MKSSKMFVMTAGMFVAGALTSVAGAGWDSYRSGLVNAGPDSNWQPNYPYYQYESFAFGNGSMTGGSLSQSVSTNADARATWYSFGYEGTNAQGQALTLGNSGLTSLSASVAVTGDALQRVTGTQPDGAGYLMGDSLTTSTSGVSMAWYVMSQDTLGGWNIWLSNAANRIDLNAVRIGGASNFSVALDALNFQSFPGYPQGSADFASTVASAQYFGLLVTSNTASGAAFDGMPLTQWVGNGTGPWNPYAIQRNGNYGAYSTGSSTITISNAVPAPGAIAVLGLAGFASRRRRA
jgi:MYXO-CTERM domain-containing protein